jgi:prolyl 4-hydroxylase
MMIKLYWNQFVICFLLIALVNFFGISNSQISDDCQDRFSQCIEHVDDCDITPGWMIVNCPKACNRCHLRDPKERCDANFLNVSTVPFVKSGFWNKLFPRLRDEQGFTVISESPWIIEKENFFSDEIIDQLINHPTVTWERSHESGEISAVGEGTKVYSAARTSSTFWCIHDCQKSHPAQAIILAVEELLQIPSFHYEPMQLLQYEPTQKYIAHHDYSVEELKLLCGPRVITAFLYLSDVEEGGETYFPNLELQVKPKKGKLLVWVNTLNSKPLIRDKKAMHEAKPVIKGVKYAANLWIHSHEWLRPSLWACTGAETTL